MGTRLMALSRTGLSRRTPAPALPQAVSGPAPARQRRFDLRVRLRGRAGHERDAPAVRRNRDVRRVRIERGTGWRENRDSLHTRIVRPRRGSRPQPRGDACRDNDPGEGRPESSEPRWPRVSGISRPIRPLPIGTARGSSIRNNGAGGGPIAFSSEVDTGSRKENASKQKTGARF